MPRNIEAPISVRLISVAAALAVLWVSMLLLGGEVSPFDPVILAYSYAGKRLLLADTAAFISHFGGWYVLVPLTFIAAGWLFIQKEWRHGLVLLGITFVGRGLVAAQKNLSDRSRPADAEQLVTVHSLSFPSGHAANSMIVYLAIAMLVFRTRAAVALALLMSLLVGVSRPILGVHWPSDVIGGWAFGLLWTVALVRLTQARGTAPPFRH